MALVIRRFKRTTTTPLDNNRNAGAPTPNGEKSTPVNFSHPHGPGNSPFSPSWDLYSSAFTTLKSE